LTRLSPGGGLLSSRAGPSQPPFSGVRTRGILLPFTGRLPLVVSLFFRDVFRLIPRTGRAFLPQALPLLLSPWSNFLPPGNQGSCRKPSCRLAARCSFFLGNTFLSAVMRVQGLADPPFFVWGSPPVKDSEARFYFPVHEGPPAFRNIWRCGAVFLFCPM